MYTIAVCGPLGSQLDNFIEGVSSQCLLGQKELVIVFEKNYCTDSYKPDHVKLRETINTNRAAVVIVVGNFLFTDKELRNLFDLKVFVDCDTDICLAQHLRADGFGSTPTILEKLQDYQTNIKPSNETIQKSKGFADIFVPQQFTAMQNILVGKINTIILASSADATAASNDTETAGDDDLSAEMCRLSK